MRYSRAHIPTLKETPSDAEVISHKLMLRAGMIRPLARGIYDFLPAGLRALRKVEEIVRQEMNRAGAQEVLLPMVQPAELWRETERWEAYRQEGLLATLKDRHEREFCLGPTHEEVITDLVRRDIRSYKDLPLNLYQIQTKFRDEIRPRFGLMRGREFIMKDAYSFDRDADGAKASYEAMFLAYRRIFTRCGLSFRPVEALSGNIGGSLSHEFQVLADSGEDAIAACGQCDYAANVEKATAGPLGGASDASAGDPENVETPGAHTVEEVCAFLKVEPNRIAKTLIYETENGLVAALVRGDHGLNEDKLKEELGVQELRLASDEAVVKATGAPVGFAGPVGLGDMRIVVDRVLEGGAPWVVGANAADAHKKNVVVGRDFEATVFADIRFVTDGDPCSRCDGGELKVVRGIEVGHVFYLGTKYTVAMEANCLDENGKSFPMEMGCYGIGVGRSVAAAIEQNHDEHGIIWPTPIAPWQVSLICANPDDSAVVEVADKIYEELLSCGLEVLYDDRPGRAGGKFKDAELIGIPYRVTVGARGLKDGIAELKARRGGEAEKVPLAEAAAQVNARVQGDLDAAMAAADALGSEA